MLIVMNQDCKSDVCTWRAFPVIFLTLAMFPCNSCFSESAISGQALQKFAASYFEALRYTNIATFIELIPPAIRRANESTHPGFFASIHLSDARDYAIYLRDFDPQNISVRRMKLSKEDEQATLSISAKLGGDVVFEKVLLVYEVRCGQYLRFERLVGLVDGTLYFMYSSEFAESLQSVSLNTGERRVYGDSNATVHAAIRAAELAAEAGDYLAGIHLLRPALILDPENLKIKELLLLYEKMITTEDRGDNTTGGGRSRER